MIDAICIYNNNQKSNNKNCNTVFINVLFFYECFKCEKKIILQTANIDQ